MRRRLNMRSLIGMALVMLLALSLAPTRVSLVPEAKCQEGEVMEECAAVRSLCKGQKDLLYALCTAIPGNSAVGCAITLSGFYQNCLEANNCM